MLINASDFFPENFVSNIHILHVDLCIDLNPDRKY